MIDGQRLLPAKYQFNPTITFDGRSVWMMYRRLSPDKWLAGPRTLGLCRLGPDLQPDQNSNLDLSERIEDPRGADRWHADPRFFKRGSEVWFSYHDNYRLYVAPLTPGQIFERVCPQATVLIGRKPRERERNWGFFDDGAFKAIYTIRPHAVLGLEETEKCFKASLLHETDTNIPWDVRSWGEPHGGCMPLRVGSYWFAFFQSASYDEVADCRQYYVGFYGFEAEPPHRIKFISTKPILVADAFEGKRSFYKGWAVAYPSGAIYHEGRWLVSLGIHDRKLALAIFDHTALLGGCTAI
jgi:predicted GH43/DUF377 family glycosyl hydrolase